MPIELHDSGSEPLGDDLHLLLVGAEKSGKSELAATAPDPVLFLDYDMRAGSFSGRKGVYCVTFRDPTDTLKQPTALNEGLEFLGKLEKSRKLKDLGFATAPDGLEVKTLVIDSITTLSNTARNFVLYGNPKELAHVVTIGQSQYRVPRNWTGWGSEMSAVESFVIRALAIPDITVIVTLHETKEEAEDSTEDNPKYTGQIAVFPVRYRILIKYFNEVWRLTRTGAGAPTIQCNPNGEFSKASSALRLSQVNGANIKQVLLQAQKQQK